MSIITPLRPFARKEPPTPLPDPKSTYDPLLKKELGNRILAISLAFLTFAYLLYFVPSLDLSRGQRLGFVSHLVVTGLFASATFAFAALPVLILRGRAVSDPFNSLPSRAQTFLALISSSRVWRTLGYFATSGFSLAAIYVAWINLTEWDDSKLSILSPTRRNIFRINERFFYIAFFNASLGLLFAARDIIRQRHVVRWPRHDDPSNLVSSSSYPLMMLDSAAAFLNLKSITSTVLITVIHLALYPLWYHSLRTILLPTLRNIPILSIYTRPLLHAFGRTWSIDVPWSRLLALGFRTTFVWEFVESAFDYWAARPISFTQFLPNPNPVLIAGIHSKDRYFKHHAYIELASLARSSTPEAASRRTSLFSDSKTNPTLWNALTRQILLTLGQNYQCLIRRGKPAPPPPPPASAPPKETKASAKTPVTPLIRRQDIVKPSPKSFFDSFASSENSSPIGKSVASAVQGTVSTTMTTTATTVIPKAFLSAPSTPLKAIEQKVEKAVDIVKKDIIPTTPPPPPSRINKTALIISLLSWMERRLPREWKVREWWTKTSVEREARASLPDVYLDIVRIEALSRLVSVSLTEDTLGVVQRDIPRVLEAFTSFLDVAESYQAELEKMLPSEDDRSALRERDKESLRDLAKAIELVVSLVQALRVGLDLICKTFGHRLGVYKFPPNTAQKLQVFME